MDKLIDLTVKEIKDLKIQGATNIAKAAVLAIGKWTDGKTWKYKELEKIAEELAFTRPTEPLTQNCIYYLLDKAKNKVGKTLLCDSENILFLLKQNKSKSIEAGLQLIKDNLTILTHCHSSSVTAIFRTAKQKGVKFKVFLTETRPRYQGHLTARELIEAGIEATLITDSEASYIISKEDKIKIDLVIVGADAIDPGGSAINKAGSYGISLSTKNAGIPFYVVASLLKYSPFPVIIEERSPKEVWDNPPAKLKILNLAFDKIPNEYITGFVTEAGIIKPEQIKEKVKEVYPWVFSKEQKGRIKKWVKTI